MPTGADKGQAQPVNKLLFALDRTAVLFIGIVVGAVIGISFFSGGSAVPGGEGPSVDVWHGAAD